MNWAAVTSLLTALTAVGALVFTGLSLNAARDQVAIAQSQNAVTEQGQFTDRYGKAVEQIGQQGAGNLQIRLGGVYALERLARDSPRDQPTIIEVLTAFVRTNTPRPTAARTPFSAVPCTNEPITADAQAALTVLGRRNPSRDQKAVVDLRETCLVGAVFDEANLAKADFTGANLTNADFFPQTSMTQYSGPQISRRCNSTLATPEGVPLAAARTSVMRISQNTAQAARYWKTRASLEPPFAAGASSWQTRRAWTLSMRTLLALISGGAIFRTRDSQEQISLARI